MRLEEVLATGELFKRPHHATYIRVDGDGVLKWVGLDNPLTFTKGALLADDWQPITFYADQYQEKK